MKSIHYHQNLIKIKNKLVVSCQAEGNSPFNSPEGVAMFAIAAQQGGAGGIRAEGIAKSKKIKESVDLPIIGLVKNVFPDESIRITRTLQEVEALFNLGIDMIAIDGTFRKVEEYDGPGLINHCKKIFPDICIIADISTNLEAQASIENGADGISTTLRGYTPETLWQMKGPIDIGFINELCQSYPDFPVIAEGKIRTPHQVKQISKIGVWSIVVGTAITRPYLITKEFVESM